MIRKQVLKSTFINSCVIFVIGIAIFAFGISILFKGINIKKNTEAVDAKVMTIIVEEAEYDEFGNKVDKDLYRYILISYEVDGVVYNNRLPYFDESLDIGSIVTVYYFLDDPSMIAGSNKYLLQSILMIAIGFILFGFKSIFFVKYYKEEKRVEKLISLNKTVDALIICVEEYDKEIKNNVIPKIIYCVYNDIEFKSTYIWESANLSGLVGHKIKVYYENDDYKNYYVDYTRVD